MARIKVSDVNNMEWQINTSHIVYIRIVQAQRDDMSEIAKVRLDTMTASGDKPQEVYLSVQEARKLDTSRPRPASY